MKNVVLLGKGSLAIKAAGWFLHHPDYSLTHIVPVVPEPDWTESISKWAAGMGVEIVSSGHYKDLEGNVDLAFSIFYDKIIKQSFIDRCACVLNLHSAPLPQYRGVRPINWALKNGEKEHGTTIHKITRGIDDGPILGRMTYPIYPEIEEVEDVYKKSLEYSWLLFCDVMSKYEFVSNNTYEQGDEFSYYSMNDSELGLGSRSGFKRSVEEIL